VDDKEKFIQTVFLHEVIHQCEFALAAYTAIQASQDNRTRFYHIQAFLVSSANVSKLLFPIDVRGTKSFKEECRKRGADLRGTLNIADNDPILGRHDLRNDFEHFDERLHVWAAKPGPNIYIDTITSIGGAPLSQVISMPGVYPKDFFRTFTSPPPVVGFLDKYYPLEPVAVALQQLMTKANSALNTRHTGQHA
jgi:hypothetical protein